MRGSWSIGALALGFWVFAATASARDFVVDTDASVIRWTGKKVGGQQSGTLKVKSGTVSFDDQDKPTAATIVIDMTSINVTSLKGSDKKKLEDLLKGWEFFMLTNWKDATFTMDEAWEQNKPGLFGIHGHLRVKSFTRELKMSVMIKFDGDRVTATTAEDAIFDRYQYHILYNSERANKNVGANRIYDEVPVTFELVAHPKKKKK